MATTPDEFRRKLSALRREYLQLLPAKVGEIESGWISALKNHSDVTQLRALHRFAHSLVGSGATFGHPGLSEAARVLEQFFKQLIEHAQPAGPEDAHRVEELLMRLRASVIHASQDMPAPEIDSPTNPVPVMPEDDETRQVFLVEDDVMLARDMALQLNHFGYAVHGFSSLADFREALKNINPDAIIMDIVLPDGDGTQALADLTRKSFTDAPTIFVTCHPDFESRLRAVRAGASAYLVKPVDISELVDKLDRVTGVDQPTPYRVMIIEDSPVLSDYYALILRQAGMLVRTVTDPAQTMPILEDFIPDLILMDAYMPGCDGFELAAVLRQQNAYMGVPIVFLSSETDLDKQLQALGTGADDFLTKPITPHHLVSAVSSRAMRARMLQELMVHDSLTGLLNHTTVKERVANELLQAKRQRKPVALAMVDIDRFKSINDNHGHLVGDRVIKSLSRLLQQRLRKSDIIGRYGGEEFLIMLNDTRGETARDLIDKLRRDFSELKHQSHGGTFNASFSCGIVAASSEIPAAVLIETADRALYQAKHNGRNQVLMVSTRERRC